MILKIENVLNSFEAFDFEVMKLFSSTHREVENEL